MNPRMAAVPAALALLAGAWSCSDSTKTIVTNDVFVYDTLYADTLYDTTVVHDTLIEPVTVWDTMFVASGRPTPVLFGLVYDVSFLFDTSGAPADSLYGGLTCFSNPARKDLQVFANADSLPLAQTQSAFILHNVLDNVLFGDVFLGLNSTALVASTLYENWVRRGTQYAFEAVVPVYPADTLAPVEFDTLRDTVGVPPLVDAFVVDAGAGSIVPSIGALGSEQSYYVVPGASAVSVSWSERADFYLVTAYKLVLSMYGATVVEEPYDTIVTNPATAYRAGYFSIATGNTDYDIAEVDVVAINGPAPGSWDTLPSFDGRGVLLGVHYDYAYALIIPEGSLVLPKCAASSATFALDRRSPVEALTRALQRE